MIHESAQVFDRIADAYDRGRPSYPQGAVDRIVEMCGIGRSSLVVDLAAGTGKLTELLIPTGATVVAVEPLAGMRANLAARKLPVEIRDGTAESIPMKGGSADLVTVAQAFHWFANDLALAEIRRVLHPKGWLALIWNQRDRSQTLQQHLEAIMEPYRGSVPTHHDQGWRQLFARSTFFRPVEEWQTTYTQEVDLDGLVARVLSVSFMASLPESAREEVTAKIADLWPAGQDRVTLQYLTDVYLCQAR